MTDTQSTDEPLTFAFAFTQAYRIAGFGFGVTPRTCRLVVADGQLRVRFGLWRLETALTNITETTVTGPYSFPLTAGPAHLSFKDRGVTFATNGDRGLCVTFREPVAGIDPTGRIKHPAMTVTVADVDRLKAALAR